MSNDRNRVTGAAAAADAPGAAAAPAACAVDPDVDCPACAVRGRRVRMQPVKAHYQCPDCHYFDSCCM